MGSNWNRLMDRLACTPLSPREGQVVAAIARRTLGWRKEADRISHAQLGEATGLDRRDVAKTLRRLEAKGIISRSGGSQGRGRMAVISLNLSGPWTGAAEKDGDSASFSERKKPAVPPPLRRAQKAAVAPAEKTAVPPHTRGKGVKTPGHSPESETLQRRAFDAYLNAGGSLRLEKERGALARGVTALAKDGIDEELILAACRDLGRKGEFPGYLKQHVAEFQERGGPCRWEGLGRFGLTRQQLLECGCSRCSEWAAVTVKPGTSAKNNAEQSGQWEGASGAQPDLVRFEPAPDRGTG